MILCCPGPSLSREVPLIRESGRVVGLVNKAYHALPYGDYWFAVDSLRNFQRSLLPDKIVSVIPEYRMKEYHNWGTVRGIKRTTCGLNRLFGDGREPAVFRMCGLPLGRGVFFALQAASIMGFKTIYLVGSELTFETHPYAADAPDTHGPDHHKRMYGTIFDTFVKLQQQWCPDFEVINCCPEGRLSSVLPTMSLREALTRHVES